jgi:glycine C-acetyltransferase
VYGRAKELLSEELARVRAAGTYKVEPVLATPQGTRVRLQPDAAGAPATGPQLVLCANNYLGLAQHPGLARAAHEALDRWGYGLSSVRFICGTQAPHKELERRMSAFLGTDETILYTSCFDANTGLFETLLGPGDAVISDELNHASIIDGIRLCKAERHRYRHADMADLEAKLVASAGARLRLVATDGVFSMDGAVAPLPEICELAEKHDALVMVDDSHAVGFMGATGRGTHEHTGVMGRVDILTGTFGKALGGASGGYTSARREIVDLLRQRSRPYLFSNTLPPAIVGAALAALDLLEGDTALRDRLMTNARRFRDGLTALGFDIATGTHPIVPIMLGDARLAVRFAAALRARGIYVVAFSYPVVPEGKARIRVQISAAHEPADLDFALQQFADVRRELSR